MGEDNLEESFRESFGMEEGRRRRSSTTMPCKGERVLQLREEKNEMKKKKRWPNRYSKKGANEVGTLL
jgi:hypothetical protein